MSQKKYRVMWSIDVEDELINSPEDAADNCFSKLNDGINDWIWQVTDLDTNEIYEVDYEFGPAVTTNLNDNL